MTNPILGILVIAVSLILSVAFTNILSTHVWFDEPVYCHFPVLLHILIEEQPSIYFVLRSKQVAPSFFYRNSLK